MVAWNTSLVNYVWQFSSWDKGIMCLSGTGMCLEQIYLFNSEDAIHAICNITLFLTQVMAYIHPISLYPSLPHSCSLPVQFQLTHLKCSIFRSLTTSSIGRKEPLLLPMTKASTADWHGGSKLTMVSSLLGTESFWLWFLWCCKLHLILVVRTSTNYSLDSGKETYTIQYGQWLLVQSYSTSFLNNNFGCIVCDRMYLHLLIRLPFWTWVVISLCLL